MSGDHDKDHDKPAAPLDAPTVLVPGASVEPHRPRPSDEHSVDVAPDEFVRLECARQRCLVRQGGIGFASGDYVLVREKARLTASGAGRHTGRALKFRALSVLVADGAVIVSLSDPVARWPASGESGSGEGEGAPVP